MNPQLSIITVALNSEKTIARTIESVLHQNYDNFNYFIIDGLSSDETVKIANSYVDAFKEKNIGYKIISEKDNGIFDAMNKGIQLSDGELVGIINSDDYYEPDAFIKVANKYLESCFDLFYADLRIIGAKKKIVKKAKIMKHFSTRYWNHPTMFVAKCIYKEFLYSSNDCADLDFILTAREKNKKIVVLNEIIANFTMGGVSNSKSWKERKMSIKSRNELFESHQCQHYKFENWFMETIKYFLSKRKKK